MDEVFLSTRQAAKRAGISHQTLYTWMERGRVQAPRPLLVGRRRVRLWTARDVRKLAELRKLIYRENEGRPRKDGRTHAKVG
jgi:excisionase family DNA binding protein